jgi:hypothetical protein
MTESWIDISLDFRVGGFTQQLGMAVAGGVIALLVWEVIVALVSRRRPVPLILYAIGAIGASTVAAILLVPKAPATTLLLEGSVATGFAAAILVALIWEMMNRGAQPSGGGVGTRVVRGLVIRGLAFSVLIFVISMIVRAVKA